MVTLIEDSSFHGDDSHLPKHRVPVFKALISDA